jgi:uncharacterized membrane protein YphA (DoxX/SURF4 family)
MNKSAQNIATLAARILLGLIFFVFGLNGFLQFLPMPQPSPAAGAFLGALAGTGYMFPLIKGVEVLSGVLLLTNRAVPLALVLLAPIAINIAAYHVFIEPGIGMVLLIGVLMGYLAYVHREHFAPLFTTKRSEDSTSPVKTSLAAR